MRFSDLHNRFGKLCSNISFSLGEQQYALISDFLRNYPCTRFEENAFDHILSKSDLEGLVQPSELWDSYHAFRKGLAVSHSHFSDKKVRGNIPPWLLYIVLSENQLLLGEKYFNEITRQHPEYCSSILQPERRRHVASVEYLLASQIEDAKIRLFLNNAYMRNWRYFRSKTPIYDRRTAVVLCGIIISSVDQRIPLSDKFIKDTLSELGRIIQHANKKKIGLYKDPVRLLCTKLGEINSPYADKALKQHRSIKYEYVRNHS